MFTKCKNFPQRSCEKWREEQEERERRCCVVIDGPLCQPQCLLVYPLLLAVLLFSNRILVFFGLLHFVLLCSFEWNLVKGKHMLWRQMSGWGEGGQKKKKHSEGRGGGEGDGGGLKGKKQPPMEWEGGELGRVEGQRKGGMLRWWGGKVTVKGKNSYLMGHKCIKESTMREMFGYFLANYHFGGGGFGSVFE